MAGVLNNILTAIADRVEGLTPEASIGALRSEFLRVPNEQSPRGQSGDRTFWFSLAESSIDETSTHATGLYSRERWTVPMKLRLAGFGPSETSAMTRAAYDVPQIVNEINTYAFWPANTVRVHIDETVNYARNDQDVVASFPISIEFEEV